MPKCLLASWIYQFASETLQAGQPFCQIFCFPPYRRQLFLSSGPAGGAGRGVWEPGEGSASGVTGSDSGSGSVSVSLIGTVLWAMTASLRDRQAPDRPTADEPNAEADGLLAGSRVGLVG